MSDDIKELGDVYSFRKDGVQLYFTDVHNDEESFDRGLMYNLIINGNVCGIVHREYLSNENAARLKEISNE